MTPGNLKDTAAPRDPAACAQVCPQLVQEALAILGTKWAPSVLTVLKTAGTPVGFAELKRRSVGITAKELSRHLKALAGAGVVHRTVFPTVPPRTEYQLTDLGERLYASVADLADWGARFRVLREGDGTRSERANKGRRELHIAR